MFSCAKRAGRQADTPFHSRVFQTVQPDTAAANSGRRMSAGSETCCRRGHSAAVRRRSRSAGAHGRRVDSSSNCRRSAVAPASLHSRIGSVLPGCSLQRQEACSSMLFERNRGLQSEEEQENTGVGVGAAEIQGTELQCECEGGGGGVRTTHGRGYMLGAGVASKQRTGAGQARCCPPAAGQACAMRRAPSAAQSHLSCARRWSRSRLRRAGCRPETRTPPPRGWRCAPGSAGPRGRRA